MARARNPWVKLNKDVKFAHGEEPAGTVGILVGPAMTLDGDGNPMQLAGYSEVHLVHQQGGEMQAFGTVKGVRVMQTIKFRGGDTREVVAVKNDDYVLVTDRNDVPADRLSTYAADWQPKAAFVKR